MFLGFMCLILGLVSFFTPLTPGSWLVFVGLELLGFRLIVSKGDRHTIWERIKSIRVIRKSIELAASDIDSKK